MVKPAIDALEENTNKRQNLNLVLHWNKGESLPKAAQCQQPQISWETQRAWETQRLFRSPKTLEGIQSLSAPQRSWEVQFKVVE